MLQDFQMKPRLICALLCAIVAGSPPPASAAIPTDQRPELALQLGHSLSVFSVTFSPDGNTLASGSDDGTVKLWDVNAHDLIRTLVGHSRSVYSVAFAPDGKTLASGSADGTAKIWSVATGQVLRTLRVPQRQIFSVAFAPDGKTLATGSADKIAIDQTRGEVTLWNPGTGAVRKTLAGQFGGVFSVAYAADGRTIASAGADKVIRLWDAQTGALRQALAGHEKIVLSVAFAPDSTTLASGGWDTSVRLWNVHTGGLEATLRGHKDLVHSVAYAPDGKTVASAGADKTIRLWDAQTGALKQTFTSASIAYAVAAAPDGSTVTSGNGVGINMWNTATGALQEGFAWRGRWTEDLAYAPDGKTLASSGGSDKAVLLWDTTTGRLLHTLSGHPGGVHATAFAPDGKTLASGVRNDSGNGTSQIFLWNVRSGRLQRKLSGHKYDVAALAFSPDGRLLASGSSQLALGKSREEIKLWNAQTGVLLRTLVGPEGSYTAALAFSPDGRLLASGATGVREKNVVRLWDMRTGKPVRTLAGHQNYVSAVAFAPDGKILASASRDNTVRIWDVRSGKLLRVLAGHGGWARSVAFSPDGKLLASGDEDRVIRIWDAGTGKALHILRGHEFGVWTVAFAPDGKRLASGSADTTVRFWDISSGRELAKLLTAPADDPEMSGPAWMVVTPEGYYHCSEGADYLFKWRFRSRLVPFYDFEETYRRPDIVRHALRGERIAARPLTLARVPPACWILNPESDANITGDVLRVLVGATDDEATPVDLQMYVNGILVPESIAKPITADAKPIVVGDGRVFSYAKSITADAKPITAEGKPITAGGKPITADSKAVPPEHRFSRILTIDVPLPPGEKDLNLRAVVYDAEKNKFDAAVTVHRTNVAPVLNDLYVLCVGVSQYRNPNYNLKFAAIDANAMAAVLKAQEGQEYAHVYTTILADRQATTTHIRAALKDMKKARPSDTVMVFLSGHGVQTGGKSYFAPWGIFIHDIESTCLPWSEIMKILSDLYAKKLLFTDACHSGDKLGPARANSEQLAEAARRRTGIMMFSSSQGTEYSYEEISLRHGAFTMALLEAFNGKADVDDNMSITLPELALYVSKRVSELTHGAQHPQLVLVQDFNPQTPLARVAAARVAGPP